VLRDERAQALHRSFRLSPRCTVPNGVRLAASGKLDGSFQILPDGAELPELMLCCGPGLVPRTVQAPADAEQITHGFDGQLVARVVHRTRQGAPLRPGVNGERGGASPMPSASSVHLGAACSGSVRIVGAKLTCSFRGHVTARVGAIAEDSTRTGCPRVVSPTADSRGLRMGVALLQMIKTTPHLANFQ
jgi:hypothetical protein